VTYRDPNVAKRFVETDATRRVDRDGAKWLGRDGTRQLDRSGVQQLDRDALKRLDRSQPPMLPTDKGTREALQGDERERRARIMSGERDMKQFGAGAKSPEEAEQWRRQGRELEQKRFQGGESGLPQATTRQLDRSSIGTQAKPSTQMPQFQRPEGAGVQATPRTRDLSRETKTLGKPEGSPPSQPTQSWGTRRSLESGQQRVDPSQMQQRYESRQFQQRVEPPVQKRTEPWQMQQRSEPRQYQYQRRVEPKSMPPPTVQRSQEGSTRQFTQQRSAPKSLEPQGQQSGKQGSQQNIRKRNDDDKTNQFGR